MSRSVRAGYRLLKPASMESRRRAAILQSAWFALSLAACLTTSAQELRSLETDRLALERFKLAVDPASSALAWATGTDPCTWAGVQCHRDRVAVLRLQRLNLTGPVPSNALGDLDQLRVLSLHHNALTGPFPVDVARCGSLRGLFLGNNRFTGPLPEVTGTWWPRLTHFDVAFNAFGDAMPESLNALSSLVALELQSNAFSGTIPRLRLAKLVRFSVAENRLAGPVPVELQRFPSASFAENAALCGPPTGNACEQEEAIVAPAALAAPGERAPSSGSSRQLSPGATAGIATGAAVILIAICCGCCRCCLLHRGTEEQGVDKSHVGKQATHYSEEDGGETATGAVDHGYAMTITRSPSRRSKRLQFLDQGKRQGFALEELLQASAEVLGKGGIMGSSYKVAMAGDCIVVVKRLRDVAAERKEFETHVEKLGRLRHRHLLPLRAYYFSREEKLLVTDFMPRGSLHSLLHGARRADRPALDWVSREKIALGCARALSYLHKPGVKVVHGDIKSSNILLTRDYEPYLCDYGMTPLLNPATAAAARLSACYRATEVMDIRNVSTRSDVYSFGVLLLELITGKVPKNEKDVGTDLPRWVLSVAREDWSARVFDPELKTTDTYAEEEMAQMLQLAVACVDRTPERRPKMDELVLLLEDITQLEASSNDSSARKKSSESPPPRSRSVSCGPTPLYTRPSSGVFVVE